MLEAYAARFDAVEIDSTYYAIPKPSLFESMVRRTPPGFQFAVKAPGSVTHAPAGSAIPIEDVDAFHACVAPLIVSGKLGAVLAQFPSTFRPGRESRARLVALRERWRDLPIVAEFRHRDWQTASALKVLRELGIGWCNVDEPRLPSLMLPGAESTSPIGYVRFHGRNAEKWWKQEHSPAERYDYLYRDEELTPWLPRISAIAKRARDTYVFFNNHRNGQAATNARQMAEMLGVARRLQSHRPTDEQMSLLDEI
jgi:uncharacterized protein YecE (DUF72 family)